MGVEIWVVGLDKSLLIISHLRSSSPDMGWSVKPGPHPREQLLMTPCRHFETIMGEIRVVGLQMSTYISYLRRSFKLAPHPNALALNDVLQTF